MIRRASKLGMRYEVKGAGGGGGTQPSGRTSVRRPAVGSGGVSFALLFFVFQGFFGFVLAFDPFTFVITGSCGFGKDGGDIVSGATVEGGSGSSGRAICLVISSADKTSLPQCSMIKSEQWLMRPLLLSRKGCSPSRCQMHLHWSPACIQVSS